MKSAVYIRALIAFLITISAAYYQRMTGPSYPLDIEKTWAGITITGDLTRSHDGESDQPVEIIVPDTSMAAVIIYRRYKSDDEWVGMKMTRDGEKLHASLPKQPPAGKLEYFVQIKKGENYTVLPVDRMVVTRFTGSVPGIVLTPHIIIMFLAMFLSSWAGLEALYKNEKMYALTYWTAASLFIGGMVLGPIVQKFAFGEFWTGIPWGFDLTDNKTLLAMILWAIAAWASYKKKSARPWIIAAAIILLLVYCIPHSTMGSELNYQTMEIGTAK
jgi:hypothetical protein